MSENRNNFSKFIKWLTMLMALSLGFFSANSQIILLREVLNFGRGNELTIASALFFWLAGIGSGAWLFAYIRSKKQTELSLYIFGITCILVSFSCTCVCRIFGIFTSQVGVAVTMKDLILCCGATMLLPGAMMGALFPLIVESGKKKVSGAVLYLLEAAGSAVGGLIFTFLLSGRVQHFSVLAFASLPLLAAQTLFIHRRYSKQWIRTVAWLVACTLAATLIAQSGRINSLTHALRWKSISGNLKLLKTIETRHQRLDFAYEHGQYSIFSDGNFDFAFPDPYDTGNLADIVLLEHPFPQRMLVIGGSPVDIVERCRAHGIHEADYVQIDPVIMELVKEGQPEMVEQFFCTDCIGNFSPADGRRFIRLAGPQKYDIVWVDLPDPLTLLVNRYYTTEIYKNIKRILRPGGLFVSGFYLDYTSPQKTSKKYSASILKTIMRSFEKNLLGFYGRIIVFASDKNGKITDRPEELSRRAAERGLEPMLYPPEKFENIFNQSRSRWLHKILQQQQTVPNTDMHPISYRLQLQYFIHLTGSNIESGTETLGETILEKSWQVTWWMALLPGVIILLLFLTLRRRETAASASLVYAMTLTGASGILLQLVLLLAYQTFSGIMYEGIGLLYAAFMIGLVAGTATGEKMKQKKPLVSEILVVINTAAVVFILPKAAEAFFIIPPLVVTSGFATGFAFPLLYAAHRRIQESRQREGFVKSAGIIDGADHVGASVGALLCALVLIPAFGLPNTLVIIMTYKLSSILILMATQKGL